MIKEVIITPINLGSNLAHEIRLDNNLVGFVFDKDLAEWIGQEVKFQLNKLCVEKGEVSLDVEDVPDRDDVVN